MAGEQKAVGEQKIASFIQVNPSKKMRIKVTANTRISGVHVDAGTLAEVTEDVGYELITSGKAEKV
jgi:hypothetical protein